MGEQGAEELRARLAAIVDSSDDAIISKNLDGVIESWNAAAERIFGYSAAEAIGSPITMLIPADRQSEETEILASIRAGQRVDHFETVRVTRGGREIQVSLTISPVCDASGRVIGASKIARDISERRRSEEMQGRLAAIVESADDAIVSKTLDGIIRSWNRGAERIFGYSPAEAIGSPITMLIPADRQGEEAEILARLRVGERIEHYETIRRTKDGRHREVSISVSPVRDAAGTIVGASKVARDITERRERERELAAQREWFRVTLSSIGDGVIASDVNGRVTFLNAVAEKLTGWTTQEVAGKPLWEVFQIVHEDTRAQVENPALRVLRSGVAVGLANHTALISRHGAEVPIADSAAPILDDQGAVIGVVLVFRDVSAERRTARALEEQREWRERLLESERAARGEAERASRLKDEFVATLSHELRTPLNAILGWAQILRKQPTQLDLVARGLDVIERNTQLQAKLVDDLLDMSRILSGKLALDLRHIDLATVVEAALETSLPAANAKGIAIETHLAPGIGPTAGDPARLQQVVWNLLANAIKFTPSGGRVELRLEQVGCEALLTVRDTGVGIEPEFLPSLFERFRQSDSATNRRFGGLGLGLAIAKQLVELHGGSVAAASEGTGRGATFHVRLPISELRLRQESDASGSAERSAQGLVTRGPNLSGLEVLVVEDDEDTAELLGRVLRSSGASVAVARSAAAALELLDERAPQILISDIGMPGVDGYELIRRIRSMESSAIASIPAVAVTAFARPEDRTRAMLAGYQAHITKPIDLAELVATVRMMSALVVSHRPGSRE